MKNLILFLSMVLFTVACNTNDESPITFKEQIIGEWQINSFVVNSCPDVTDNLPLALSDDNGCVDIMGDTSCMSILFLENGTAEVNDSEIGGTKGVQTMTYELNELNSTINICQDAEDCATFSLREDSLYTEMDEDGCICILGFKKM